MAAATAAGTADTAAAWYVDPNATATPPATVYCPDSAPAMTMSGRFNGGTQLDANGDGWVCYGANGVSGVDDESATNDIGAAAPGAIDPSQPLGDPAAVLGGSVKQAMHDTELAMLGLMVQNLPWIIGFLTFFLAVRFAPALLSWFRHRNDPKQLPMF